MHDKVNKAFLNKLFDMEQVSDVLTQRKIKKTAFRDIAKLSENEQHKKYQEKKSSSIFGKA